MEEQLRVMQEQMNAMAVGLDQANADRAALHTQLAASNAQVNLANAAVTALVGEGAGVDGARRERERKVLNLREYTHEYQGIDNDKAQLDFLNWLQHLEMVARSNRWTLETTICATIGSMVGNAGVYAKTIPKQAAEYRDLNDFYARLKAKFVDASFEQVAQQKFEARRQKPGEPLQWFHGHLKELWSTAFERTEEAWRFAENVVIPAPYQAGEEAGQRSNALRRKFLAGIYDKRLQERLRDHLLAQGGWEAHLYNTLLTTAISLESHTRMANDAAGGYRSYFRHQNFSRPPAGGGEGPQPMEIGALREAIQEAEENGNASALVAAVRQLGLDDDGSQSQNGDGHRGAVGAMGRGEGGRWCTHHQVSTHNTADCWQMKQRKDAGGKGPNDGAGKGAKKKGPKCFECGGFGHLSHECANKKKKEAAKARASGKAAAAAAATGADREEPAESDSETEEVTGAWGHQAPGNGH